MSIPTTAPYAYADLFVAERARLLDVLSACAPADWSRSTCCPGWDVRGLATHVLGDDLGLLAGRRDGHRGTPAPAAQTEAEFIAWLDDVQAEWVHAARRLSPRLTVELLTWTGPQVADVVSAEDPAARTAKVSWASADPVPVWLDHARELSERWIHRQQLLEALGHASDLGADLAGPVFDALRWAYPYRLAAFRRAAGSTVTITVEDGSLASCWSLVSDGRAWQFAPGDQPAIATLRASAEQAWRLLTNNLRPEHGPVEVTGDTEITTALLRVRAIIGEPR